MPDQTQIRSAKCPYCGYENRIDAAVVEEGNIDVTMGLGSAAGSLARTLQGITAPRRAERDLEEANAWIDIKCPNCPNLFQYNTRTGEVRR